MTGGNWITQNKVRPGAYINFKSVAAPITTVGTRGILTMPLALDWGAEYTELLSTDLLNGKSFAKIGYSAFDDEAQIFREALKSCYKLLLYRLDTGGVKATATLSELVATAKYAGIAGNKISIAKVAVGTKFDVITFFRGIEKDRQRVTTVGELVDNDFVDFSGTASAPITANAGTYLATGANGTVTLATAYPAYLALIGTKTFNTMAIPADAPTIIPNIVTFIKDLRDKQGVKCQAVVYNDVSADYEGIISTKGQGYKTKAETVSPTTFVATVGGLEAGAEITQSLTNYVIEGATEIVNELQPDDIETALKAGYLVLSKRRNGKIKIEQDINTFVSFTPEKSRDFSKNKIVRVLDEINNSVKDAWENGYEGKVDNDNTGRKAYKGDCLNYLNLLQRMRAVDNVDPDSDVVIQEGDAKDSVYALIGAEPVDAMEKLYMLVQVR